MIRYFDKSFSLQTGFINLLQLHKDGLNYKHHGIGTIVKIIGIEMLLISNVIKTPIHVCS